jgi:hypothetical protein
MCLGCFINTDSKHSADGRSNSHDHARRARLYDDHAAATGTVRRLADMAALREQGYSARQIAKRYWLTPEAVRNYLWRHKIAGQPRGGDRRSKAYREAQAGRE